MSGSFTHLEQGGANVMPRIGSAIRPDRQHRVADDIGNEPAMLGDWTEQGFVVDIQKIGELLGWHGFGKRGEVRRVGRDAATLHRSSCPADVLRVLLQHCHHFLRNELRERFANPVALPARHLVLP